MTEPKQVQAMDLASLFNILWSKKFMIIIVTLLFVSVSTVIAFIMTPKYDASILLQPVNRNNNSAVSSLANNFGGVASLAGISLGGGSDETSVSIATLTSRHLLTSFIQEKKLLPLLFPNKWSKDDKKWKIPDIAKQPSSWDAYEKFIEKIIKVNKDAKTGLVTLTIRWRDPGVAVEWAHDLVNRVNDYLRIKAKKETEDNLTYLQKQIAATTIAQVRESLAQALTAETERSMMANVSSEYAFKIIDPAVKPDLDDYASPQRLLMIISAFILGFLLSSFVVIVRYSP